MSDGILAKLVVTVIVLISFFAIWLALEKHQPPGCQNNCPTDISASQRSICHIGSYAQCRIRPRAHPTHEEGS